MHARPSLKVKLMAEEYPNTSIQVIDPTTKEAYNARSLLELMTMIKDHDEEVIVRALGDREKEASERIAKLISEYDIDD